MKLKLTQNVAIIIPAGTILEGDDITIAPAPIPTPVPTPVPVPVPGAFQLYAPTSFWNKKLTNESLHPQSASLITELWANVKIASGWISGTQYSTPIYFVDASVPKVPVYKVRDPNGTVGQEFLAGVRLPAGFKAADGGDGHACIIDTSAPNGGNEYDMWQVKWNNNRWECTDGGILHGVGISDGTMARLAAWNSATATHIPLAGGKITKAELDAYIATGAIPQHGLSLSINRPAPYPFYKYPAKSCPDGITGGVIQYGQRFRFPANIGIDLTWCLMTKLLVTMARDYGITVMDRTGAGASFYIQDPSQFGLGDNIMKPLVGKHFDAAGNYITYWTLLGNATNASEFPWSKLVALA